MWAKVGEAQTFHVLDVELDGADIEVVDRPLDLVRLTAGDFADSHRLVEEGILMKEGQLKQKRLVAPRRPRAGSDCPDTARTTDCGALWASRAQA